MRTLVSRWLRVLGVVGALGLIVVPSGAGAGPAPPAAGPPAANCAQTATGFPPLIDLGTGLYHGYPGGLYPAGANQPPPAYLQAGIGHAHAVRPLNASGQPDPN